MFNLSKNLKNKDKWNHPQDIMSTSQIGKVVHGDESAMGWAHPRAVWGALIGTIFQISV